MLLRRIHEIIDTKINLGDKAELQAELSTNWRQLKLSAPNGWLKIKR